MSVQTIQVFPRAGSGGVIARAVPAAHAGIRPPVGVPAFPAILRKILASTRSAWQLDGAAADKS